ncbi:nucleic acid-binding, OB-fold protein, partial [Tanacetum coccineum]
RTSRLSKDGTTYDHSRQLCRVSKYIDYQLAASPATYYYLNSNIPEAQESRALFKSRYQETPQLIICKLLYQDIEKEKLKNRYPLKTITEQNPVSYKAIRFTAEATITSINTNRDWYYVSCHQCNKAAINQREKYRCLDHGPQPRPFFRYLLPTLFTKTSIFQFHFNTFANTTDLTLDEVFDIKTTDESTSNIAEQTYKAVQPVEDQEQEAKGKEQTAEEHRNKGGTTKEKPTKRPLFTPSSTDPKKDKDN